MSRIDDIFFYTLLHKSHNNFGNELMDGLDYELDYVLRGEMTKLLKSKLRRELLFELDVVLDNELRTT